MNSVAVAAVVAVPEPVPMKFVTEPVDFVAISPLAAAFVKEDEVDLFPNILVDERSSKIVGLEDDEIDLLDEEFERTTEWLSVI